MHVITLGVTTIEDWPIHRSIFYNHWWHEHLDRGVNLFKTAVKGPDHYSSWEVVAEMLCE
jgi:hypothetical protein